MFMLAEVANHQDPLHNQLAHSPTNLPGRVVYSHSQNIIVAAHPRLAVTMVVAVEARDVNLLDHPTRFLNH
jgi:hypothetical protein